MLLSRISRRRSERADGLTLRTSTPNRNKCARQRTNTAGIGVKSTQHDENGRGLQRVCVREQFSGELLEFIRLEDSN